MEFKFILGDTFNRFQYFTIIPRPLYCRNHCACLYANAELTVLRPCHRARLASTLAAFGTVDMARFDYGRWRSRESFVFQADWALTAHRKSLGMIAARVGSRVLFLRSIQEELVALGSLLQRCQSWHCKKPQLEQHGRPALARAQRKLLLRLRMAGITFSANRMRPTLFVFQLRVSSNGQCFPVF